MPEITCHALLLIFPVDSWMRRKYGSSRGRTMKTSATRAASTPVTRNIRGPFSRKSTGKEQHEHAQRVGDVHDPRAQQRAHVVEVIGGAGDKVAVSWDW